MKRLFTLLVILIATSSWINSTSAQNVNIPDSTLAAAVREQLGLDIDAPITQEAMRNLTRLELDSIPNSISDLTGLEYATQLEVLSLGYSNQVSDLTPLEGLTQLEILRLGATLISDLTPLEGLTQLEAFSVACSPISDITPLKDLTNLKTLQLICIPTISDITPLKDLTNIEWLSICGTSVSDITPLKDLTNIEWLALRNNQISDTSSLTGLTNLETLELEGNQISDTSSLTGLTSLKTLTLQWNQISDVTPLTSLKSLEGIKLMGNPITTADTTLENLPILDILVGTGVDWMPDDVLEGFVRGALNLGKEEPLTKEAMQPLFFMDASRLEITDLTGLEHATQLEILFIGGHQISDLTPLTGLTQLKQLNLVGHQISDLTPLTGLTQLEALYLSFNQISNISALTGLTNLKMLELQWNQISDVTPLTGLEGLASIKLAGNPITTADTTLENLPILDILVGTGVDWMPDDALEGFVRGTLNLGREKPLTKQAMQRLFFLSAPQQAITDLTGLEYATQLIWLFLEGNQISDLTPLTGLTQLEALYLMNNQISDLTPLEGLTQLKQLWLSGNSISDLTPLQTLLEENPDLEVDITVPAAPATVTASPNTTVLHPNYPNPFNPETWIPYELATDTNVQILIYDVRGILVRRLELGYQAAGIYVSRSRAAYWDGRNALGERVASGVYFYTLTAGEFTATQKMLIRK